MEEFVEFNTPKVYRGQSVGEKGIPREGLSTSFDFNQANKYARARGLGAEKQTYYLNLNAKKISLEDVPNEVRGLEEGSDFAGKAAIWARKNGYDILDMSKGNEAEMRILTEKAFTTEAKTKSQLEDIWKKANAGSKVDPLIVEAKKYKGADFNPSTSYLKRNIEVLNKNGIKVKNPDEVITLYHGTNAKGLKGITETGTLNPGSFLATDINASKGFVFGKGGDVIKIQVPVKDLGFVQDGGMSGSKGVSIQTIDKLIKGKDGIWRIK